MQEINRNIILRLEDRGIVWKKCRIVVAAPAAQTKLTAGTLEYPDKSLWNPTGAYIEGEIDAESLSNWLRQCLGDPILNLIRESYPEEPERLRLTATAAEEFRSDLMKVPWEVLESFDSSYGLPYGERLDVVRVLQPESEAPEPQHSSEPLRVAILWANPDNDIPGLEDHLKELQDFIKNRELDLSLIGPVEFVSQEAVRRALEQAHPQIVYHIGHAVQQAGQKVELKIGPRGKPSACNAEEFRLLLQEVGPPRLLLLSACASTIGYEFNPYLGAALSCAEQIDAVISMQTMVPVKAAIAFAGEFFRGFIQSAGLTQALKRGRYAMQRSEPLNSEARQSFTPFIPVLLQRTAQNQLFRIDPSGRELRLLLTLLGQRLNKIRCYLPRAHDEAIMGLLRPAGGSPRVGVICGPQQTGKSTSIRQAVRSLLTEDRYKAGERYLYYEAQPQDLPADDPAQQIHHLLVSFATQFSPLTRELANALTKLYKGKPEEAIAVLSSWLREEERDGKTYCVCLDNLPSELAGVMAESAANSVTGGALALAAEAPHIAPLSPVTVINVKPMTAAEIRPALEAGGQAATDAEVDQALAYSNGLPFFVAADICYGSRRSTTAAVDLASAFFDHLNPGLSAEQVTILRFAALCQAPIPESILTGLYDRQWIDELVNKEYLLMKTEAGAFRLPDGLRDYLLRDLDDEEKLNLHGEAHGAFLSAATQAQASQEEPMFQLASEWFLEAFKHTLNLARGESNRSEALEWLDVACQIAETLHDRLLKKEYNIGAAKAIWEQYREVANTLEKYEDRRAFALYADCLIELGNYALADELLEQVTFGNDLDNTQLTALQLRSNLIKEQGEHDAFSARLAVLRQALEVAHQLANSWPDPLWVKQQIADLEFKLGNALSYGKEAMPAQGLEHIEQARQLFVEMRDYRQFRAVNEAIEVKRYNDLLTEPERQEAIETLRKNVRLLITRGRRYDAVMHFYEMGRLETDLTGSANWFRQAFERAKDQFEPENWHAAINWRMNEIKAKLTPFDEVAAELEGYADRLQGWQTRAWSRRKRREVLYFLAKGYEQAGNRERALVNARACWQMAAEIARHGEGRKDPARRREAAGLLGRLALEDQRLDEARAVAIAMEADAGLDRATSASLNETQLREFFSRLEGSEER